MKVPRQRLLIAYHFDRMPGRDFSKGGFSPILRLPIPGSDERRVIARSKSFKNSLGSANLEEE